MINKKCKILVVDKKGKYPFLFRGFRKHKYVISQIDTLLLLDDDDLNNYNLFFIVLYEVRDIFEVLKNHNANTPIILASENSKIIKKIEQLKCFSIVNLSQRANTTIGVQRAMIQTLKLI
jgi:hypothetical protein